MRDEPPAAARCHQSSRMILESDSGPGAGTSAAVVVTPSCSVLSCCTACVFDYSPARAELGETFRASRALEAEEISRAPRVGAADARLQPRALHAARRRSDGASAHTATHGRARQSVSASARRASRFARGSARFGDRGVRAHLLAVARRAAQHAAERDGEE